MAQTQNSQNVADLENHQLDTGLGVQMINGLSECTIQPNHPPEQKQGLTLVGEQNVESKEDLEDILHDLLAKYSAGQIRDAMEKLTMDNTMYEPILDPKNKKFTAFPITYQHIWDKYKIQMACFWKEEEIDFSGDYEDFMTLNAHEQHFVEMVLAFFAASDGIVNFNLSERFTKEIQNTEIIFTYQYQAMMENIHSSVYSLMLDNIIKDQDRKNELFDAINTIESIKLMSDWALKWIESSESFAHRVVAFVLVEGLFFQGPFAALFWLKKYKNKNRDTTKVKPFMCGLMDSNKFIARDEGQHTYFGCDVYNLLQNKLTQPQINEIFADALFLSKKFMEDAIPVKLIGMNFSLMEQYLESIADRLLVLLGYKKVYMATNPFKFMETIGLNDKTNFFEKRPTEYQDSHIMNKSSKSKIVIKDDGNF
jgi:ribonucleotide reductase beta subunit family protein with ferritin-like domain